MNRLPKIVYLLFAFVVLVLVAEGVYWWRLSKLTSKVAVPAPSPTPAKSSVIKNSEENIARMSYTQRKDITRILGTIEEIREDSFVIGKGKEALLINIPSSGISILEQEKTPDGATITTIKPTSHLTNESIGRKAVVILDKEEKGYPERLVAKEIHILTKE